MDKLYLLGSFGQGGSSTFYFCPYAVILSRRCPILLDSRNDEVGWTIVRKYDDDSLKAFRYEYLVDSEGQVPRFRPNLLPPEHCLAQHGTYIIHVAYDLGRLRTRFSLNAYRYFDHMLFDPVLPYALEDHRQGTSFNRVMRGARARLDSQERRGRVQSGSLRSPSATPEERRKCYCQVLGVLSDCHLHGFRFNWRRSQTGHLLGLPRLQSNNYLHPQRTATSRPGEGACQAVAPCRLGQPPACSGRLRRPRSAP